MASLWRKRIGLISTERLSCLQSEELPLLRHRLQIELDGQRYVKEIMYHSLGLGVFVELEFCSLTLTGSLMIQIIQDNSRGFLNNYFIMNSAHNEDDYYFCLGINPNLGISEILEMNTILHLNRVSHFIWHF